MNIIEKDGYKFTVDIENTREYYKTHSLCDCSACRNYYAQIKDFLPSADEWLNDFGVDISRPDETTWYQNDDETISYDACYTVCGKVAEHGRYEFDFKDKVFTSAVITDPNDVLGDFPNEQTGEYFGIIFYNITLPWILDEPLSSKNVVKKKKERRGWHRLCDRKQSSIIQ